MGRAKGEEKMEAKRLEMRRAAFLGFTLIEVLLALLLTMILLAGIYNLFGSQEKSQALVDQVSEMNQNLRVAAATITRDMRMAGYHLEDARATSGTGGARQSMPST